MKDENVAVLTGDFIDSQSLSVDDHRSLVEYFKALPQKFEGIHPNSITGEMDVFRGDSWQLCLHDLSQALNLAVFLRVGLKAHPLRLNIDTRIGIGFGTIDKLESKVSESLGSAFLCSGEALEVLSKNDLNLGMQVAPNFDERKKPIIHSVRQTYIPLLDDYVSSFSTSESQAIFGQLCGKTQKETAEYYYTPETPVTQQSVNNALKRTSWKNRIEPSLGQFELLLNEL